jgi:hypothetical protein
VARSRPRQHKTIKSIEWLSPLHDKVSEDSVRQRNDETGKAGLRRERIGGVIPGRPDAPSPAACSPLIEQGFATATVSENTAILIHDWGSYSHVVNIKIGDFSHFWRITRNAICDPWKYSGITMELAFARTDGSLNPTEHVTAVQKVIT